MSTLVQMKMTGEMDYLGPSLLVNLDDRGMVRSLEFVGVQPDNDYISEV